jgi:hypothetical protein
MSDVNVMPKRAGTKLSDGTNKLFMLLNVLWTAKLGTNFANKRRSSVGIVRSRTQATDFCLFLCLFVLWHRVRELNCYTV